MLQTNLKSRCWLLVKLQRDRTVNYQNSIAYEWNYIVRLIKLQHLVSYRPDLDIYRTHLRLVFTSDGVVIGVVIRRVERYDLVKIKPTESEAEH